MIALVGSGGHAKVVIDALLAAGTAASHISLRDGNPERAGARLMEITIACPELPEGDALVHLAFGDCARRLELLAACDARGLALQTIRHPASIVAPTAALGVGCFAAAGCIVAPFAQIGRSVILNHGAVIDHDCVVGDASHIAPNATLGGGVSVGHGVLVGSGATVLPGRIIGDGAIIGAGAVVTRDVAAGEIRVGNPRLGTEL